MNCCSSALTMVVFSWFPHPMAALCLRHVSLFYAPKTIKKCVINAKLETEKDDLLFQNAMQRASLRLKETLRADPLFVDPYIECLSPPDILADANCGLHKHCLATKFIDDKLVNVMRTNEELRQVVLMTDGMDTRPYKLNWPASTVLFDVSPERIFKQSVQKLEDVGAKIPRRCLLLHVPSETSDIQQHLQSKGFNGSRPSVWVFQGFPILSLANFKDILNVVSNLATKGCLLFGEMPVWLGDIENGTTSTTRIDKLFMGHGLRVELLDYEEVAHNLGKELAGDRYINTLFVAEKLQYSDDQMSFWRTELQRIEEEGDEEGFEEL
ncbi:O-methyltransferase 1, chloroplastic isoform X2 [Primulina tabacum]|uniref:O-methyltransferase 1, chloroplastic isoform X2 n=1 Tax=Primulina tabacum TaxID=48773 RepID=UPI003F593FD4